MSPMHRLAATVALVATFLAATPVTAQPPPQAAEQANPPAAPPAEGGKQATKSRSNIQNNREAAPMDPTTSEPATDAEGTALLKTKTKSNQSND